MSWKYHPSSFTPLHHIQASLGKRKLDKVEGAVTKRLPSALKLDYNELEIDKQLRFKREIQSKADDVDQVMECMTEKLKVSNQKQKLQTLTLTQDSWSVRKAAEVFKASK